MPMQPPLLSNELEEVTISRLKVNLHKYNITSFKQPPV